jgi:hypothetical protein
LNKEIRRNQFPCAYFINQKYFLVILIRLSLYLSVKFWTHSISEWVYRTQNIPIKIEWIRTTFIPGTFMKSNEFKHKPEEFVYTILNSSVLVWYILKNTQVVTDLQTSCNKVVGKPISGCVRTACSQLLWQVWNKLLSPCYKVDDGNRLATSCSNKTNTGCS